MSWWFITGILLIVTSLVGEFLDYPAIQLEIMTVQGLLCVACGYLRQIRNAIKEHPHAN